MGRPQKIGKVAIIGTIADLRVTRQMIAESTTGQAISGSSRRSGRPQILKNQLNIGAIRKMIAGGLRSTGMRSRLEMIADRDR